MKGLNGRPHSRGPGALWLSAPLVLAACVAAEAAPAGDLIERAQGSQVSLGRLVRDGVARLARGTRPTINHAQVTFVLLTLERLTGGSGISLALLRAPVQFVAASTFDIFGVFLDPGRTSSPTAAP